MKKYIRMIGMNSIVLWMLLISVSFSAVPTFEAGLIGDPTLEEGIYEYQEYFFLTGKKILLTGTVEVPTETPTGNNYTETYSFSLVNNDENISLQREITYAVTKTEEKSVNQTLYKAKISDISESIDVDGTSYNLGGYLFDRTKVIDNTPAVDYYSGNVYFKRTYYIDGNSTSNEGKIVHEITSTTNIGYDHHWGDSETLVLNHQISATVGTGDDATTWSAIFDSKNSATDKRRFQYLTTDPQNISFRGSYIKRQTMENILQVTYNLPTVDGDSIDEKDRIESEETKRQDIATNQDSLISPKIEDIGGHWAEEDVFLLSSLGIFENTSSYFGPNTPINRLEFGKAISKSLDTIEEEDTTDEIIRQRNETEMLFKDIPNDHPDYEYIKYLKDKNIMSGEYGELKPLQPLTRAEAVEIMVDALGLKSLAPMPPYRMPFYTDDASIPKWARDAVYVSNQIDLVSGYPDGTFRPHKQLTKAEAATLIMAFIDHIRERITIDYREKVINKY